MNGDLATISVGHLTLLLERYSGRKVSDTLFRSEQTEKIHSTEKTPKKITPGVR